MKTKQRRMKLSKKIIGMVLGLAMFSMFLTTITNLISLSNLQSIASDSLQELGDTAASDAELALQEQAQKQLISVASEKASYIELLFDNVVECLHGMASMAENIYANPDSYPNRTVALPIPGNSELAAQLLKSERITKENESVYMEELNKLANVQDLLVQYNQNNAMISSTYVATVSGLMIQADYISYSKYANGSTEPLTYEADTRQWFQRALEAEEGEVVYTDVIADAHGGGDCIVCAQPVYCDGEIVAVAGIGSYLETVSEVVLQTKIGETGYAFLVNQYGQIMISPKKEGETAADTSESVDLRDSSNLKFAQEIQKMVGRESGVAQIELDGERKYIAYVPLQGLNWSFVTVMDEKEVLELAKESQNTILELESTANEQMSRQFRLLFRRFLMSAIFLILLTIVFGLYFSSRLTKPLLKLKKDAQTIGTGNLDYQIEIHTGDEIEELADTFNQMKMELKNYIASLNRVTAEKERIGAELDVAQRIQKDMLPQIFPPFPERTDFDIYADMQPAKEVGGDFYDFFFVDDSHLAIVIADVSGKGVPAALFMVIAKTLLKNHMQAGETPEQAFYHVNNQLCENNEEGMFVTAWLAVYDFDNEILTCVNAGHNPPVIIEGEEQITFYEQPSGFILAGFEDFVYEQYELPLKPGTKIFVYTDGLTEANNEKEELYGEKRLLESIKRYADESPMQLIKKVKEELFAYMGGAAQFDDVTMLCFQIKSPELPKKQFQVNESLVGAVTEYVECFLEEQRCEPKIKSEIAIAIDEICSNVLYYAYPNGKGTMEICCETEGEGMIKICFEDSGIPYNPLDKGDPDVNLTLEEREIGGLGIYMVKQLMDREEYEYRDGKNCFTIWKKMEIHS